MPNQEEKIIILEEIEDYEDLSIFMLEYSSLFYSFWELGKPVFSDKIETACVMFGNDEDDLLFLFNKKFWEKSSSYEKLFTICHELLHVYLKHGFRIDKKDMNTFYNYSVDIVVNHLLINRYGFEKERLSDWKKFCWVETVFPNTDISEEMSCEYYYSKLMKQGSTDKLCTVDSHKFLGTKTNKDGNQVVFEFDSSDKDDNNEGEKELSNILDDYIEKALDGVSEEDIEDLMYLYKKFKNDFENEKISAGDNPEKYVQKVKNNRKKDNKIKWENLIKKWVASKTKMSFKNKQQWARENRRTTMLNSNLILPSDMEIENKINEKYKVLFFLDTSGSCYNFSQKFWDIAKNIRRDIFDVEFFNFDTEIHKINEKDAIFTGYGGTSFACLNDYVNSLDRHPDGIFVITDGYANGKVVHKKPEKWAWLLTTDNISCIDAKCKILKKIKL